MDIAKFLVVFVLVYYTRYIFTMIIFRKKSTMIKEANKHMDVLRETKVKTLEEQKAFLNIKYPKASETKYKFTWKGTGKTILNFAVMILTFLILYKTYYWLFDYIGITTIKMWQMVLFIIIFPMIINQILSKFGWQKSDLSLYLK